MAITIENTNIDIYSGKLDNSSNGLIKIEYQLKENSKDLTFN